MADTCIVRNGMPTSGCCEPDQRLFWCDGEKTYCIACAENEDPTGRMCGYVNGPDYFGYDCGGDPTYAGWPYRECCRPDCWDSFNNVYRQCGGDDGCGGTCGTTDSCAKYGPFYHCDPATFACVCVPDCKGWTCGGYDGCRGNCGTCPDGLVCREGNCETQDCEGVDCNDRWILLTSSGPAGDEGSAAADPDRGRIVAQMLSSLWEWDGTTWTDRTPAGEPFDSGEGGLVYDPLRKVFVALWSEWDVPYNVGSWSVWEGNIAGWTHRLRVENTGNVEANRWSTPAWDPVAGAVMAVREVCTGYFTGCSRTTVHWNGSAWVGASPATEVPFAGYLVQDPSGRKVYSTPRNYRNINYKEASELWEWDGANWLRASDWFPQNKSRNFVPAWDVHRDRLVLVGRDTSSYGDVLATWEWDRQAWTRVAQRDAPPRLAPVTLVFDPVRRQMLFIGGREPVEANWTRETWARVVCEPDCAGRQCGDDGCGTECGTCGSGLLCQDGRCSPPCEPDCTGRQCGDDGCGGLCGVCPGDRVCEGGACVTPCLPDCRGNECGDNGCGQPCGICPKGFACVLDSCCDQQCGKRTCGPDACGGNCGTCPSGWECVENSRCSPVEYASDCADAVSCFARDCGGPEQRITDDTCAEGCLDGISTGGAALYRAYRDCVKSSCAALAGPELTSCTYDSCLDPLLACVHGNLSCSEVLACMQECPPIGNPEDSTDPGLACARNCLWHGTVQGQQEYLAILDCLDERCDDEPTKEDEAACRTIAQTGECANTLLRCRGLPCVHWCRGRECGDDQCGGSCGTCPDGQTCTEAYLCCAPACQDRECGEDGCGGQCGTCREGWACGLDNRCTCLPDCSRRDCGDDGCGGSCGTCSEGTVCVEDGTLADCQVPPIPDPGSGDEGPGRDDAIPDAGPEVPDSGEPVEDQDVRETDPGGNGSTGSKGSGCHTGSSPAGPPVMALVIVALGFIARDRRKRNVTGA